MMKNKLARYVAAFMALNLAFEVISPTLALALTNGTVQPEMQGFQPAGSSEMVDLFTGDFKYNIPLMDVDGYPLNIAYQAGQNMESEASWVGLGWSLNPGVMNRMMRGLPDDFNGDEIKTETNIRSNVTVGVGIQSRLQLGGSTGFGSYVNIGVGLSTNQNLGAALNYNNYTGHSLELQYDHSANLSTCAGVLYFTPLAGSVTYGVGFRISTSEGVSSSSYASKGYNIWNGYHSEKAMGKFDFLFSAGLTVNSAQRTSGTTINSRTGMSYDFYSQSNTSKSLQDGLSLTETFPFTTAIMPNSSLSFPPRINHAFTGSSEASTKLAGFYACAPLPLFPVSLTAGIQVGVSKYKSTSELIHPSKNFKAYGYMNLEGADENAMMDFNRFKEGVYMREAPNGSYASLTNDIFLSSAQGMSSSFRAFRSDYGTVHDPMVKSINGGTTKSNNIALGVFYQREKDQMNTYTEQEDGSWYTSPLPKFTSFDPAASTGDACYEKFYFKQMGEPTSVDLAYESIGGGQGTKEPDLVQVSNTEHAATNFYSGNRAGGKEDRAVRNTHISSLNAQEASNMALVKAIRTFSLNQFDLDASTRAMSSFTTQTRKGLNGMSNIDHHLSEITVTKDDGSRYIYGIPVYNHSKKEVVFNASDFEVNGLMGAPSSNTVTKSNYLKMLEYTSTDASVNNVRGIDNYFSSTETPPYAQSFLLTSIISADYVDLTGNGPTQDDLGNYVIFNYSNTNTYRWRSPFNATPGHPNLDGMNGATKSAHLSEGLRSDEFDDKGTYEYGTRDNWYLHSIESKNHVAEFEISERDDNCGVLNEDGDIDVGSSYKLDQIRLYSKEEKIRAQASSTTPIPLKAVSFEYDYSLCKGVFNNKNNSSYNTADNSGKLTLKKVYFTYGESKKSALSPYKFTYGDSDHDPSAIQEANPNYDPRAMDRWGNYKPNTGALDNMDFSYAEQDQGLADTYAAAWNLTTIETPSGAKTDVYYESDDYCYVQDEPTGVMLKIAGLFPSIDKTPVVDYASVPPFTDIFQAPEALIDLQRLNVGISTTLSKSQADALVRSKMFPGDKKLYLRCKTKLAYNQMYKNLITKDYWEYVPCYAAAEASGIVDIANSANTYTTSTDTYYKYAWVRLQMEEVVENTTELVNPIARAGWQMVRSCFPKLAYPGSQPNANILNSNNPLITLNSFITALGVALQDHKLAMQAAQNRRFMSRGYCKSIDYDDSWVRAYAPYKKKTGGGHRVKQIITNDNWSGMVSSETSSRYGQTYDYTTKEAGASISSGVTSYEPIVGGDEISLHQPINFSQDKSYAPNDHYFQETPYMEHLYPSAFVGYSKVTVKNLEHEYPNGSNPPIKIRPIGKTVYEFYTAKEFPVIENTTPFQKLSLSNDPIDEYIISSERYNVEDCSQGFSIKMNDMHGKLKSIKVYSQDNETAPISGTTYYYKSFNINNKGAKELDQDAYLVDRSMTIQKHAIGRNIDVTMDSRRSVAVTTSVGESMQRRFSICNPIPKKFIMPQKGVSTLAHSAASITKIIQQYGILDKVETFTDKNTITTQNMLRDAKTGEVVLTRTTNNFDQPVYTFNEPAYWAYDQMGHRYARQGSLYKLVYTGTPGWTGNTGEFSASTLAPVFTPGDEVFVYKEVSKTSVGSRFWITQSAANPLKWLLVDVDGNTLTDAHPDLSGNTEDLIIKLDRPIERNLQSLKMASIATLKNPVTGTVVANPSQDVISASAIEYCQLWDYYKNSSNAQAGLVLPANYDPAGSSTVTINPYSAHLLGSWRPWRSYAYNESRAYNTSQPDDKSDGLFVSFSPFWSHTPGSFGGTWASISSSSADYAKWVVQNENRVYSPYGYLMETMDAFGISSASRLGFNHTLPVLKASNASAREVGFDSFEEYENLFPSFGSSTNKQLISNDQLGFFHELNSSVFTNSSKAAISTSEAHSGRFSASFSANQNLVITHGLENSSYEFPPARCDVSQLYNLNKLMLNSNYKYLVSFWVKGKVAASDYQSNVDLSVQALNGSTSALTSATLTLQRSALINGWQKFDYEFTPPNLLYHPNNAIIFTISAPSGTTGFYMDDFRLQPSRATMACTVYDPYSLRPWAQLDDRNFATFMEYDTEGSLVRTKKETVNGVYTLNENRKGLKK